jgi:hypothetical protein
MTPELNEALVNLAVAVVVALSTALTALIGVWTQRLRSKIQSERATEYLKLLEDLTRWLSAPGHGSRPQKTFCLSLLIYAH